MKTMKMRFQPSNAGGWLIPALMLAGLALAAGGPARARGKLRRALDAQRNFNAVQTVYRRGVPQLTKHGHVLFRYDPQRSFFPIGAWGVPSPGKVYDYTYHWSVLKKAGFNTVWPWMGNAVGPSLKAAQRLGLHVVLMGPLAPSVLRQAGENPLLLGNVWRDEPIGQLGAPHFSMEKLYRQFLGYKKMAHNIAPNVLVFINDAPWIMPPATSWWVRWNDTGDISCDDNYPIVPGARSIGADPNGIPQAVSLAVASDKERKPVWLIVGAFEQAHRYGQPFPFSFPTPTQLRAEVYAGIISGATGISYFIWDSYVARDGVLIGMSPDPRVAYSPNPQRPGTPKPTPATPMQLVQSRALWQATTVINRELAKLTPVILSPTVGSQVAYKVAIHGKSVTADPIRCLLKPDPRGGYVLLTVNLDDAVLGVRYTFPEPLREVATMFNHQPPLKFNPPAKTFSAHYEPFETHVFRVLPAAAGARPESQRSGGRR